MEEIMKKLMTITTALFVFCTAVATAQPSEKALKNASEKYLIALNHENSGVIESAIVQLMKLKIVRPKTNFDDCIARLEELHTSGPTQIIRIKAGIAHEFLTNPDKSNIFKIGLFDELSSFFDDYCEKLARETEKTVRPLVIQEE
jgi:hypothetical protein